MKFWPLLLLAMTGCATAQTVDYRTLHRDALVVDTHNDVLSEVLDGRDMVTRSDKGHSDLPRLAEGGVDVEVFSVWVDPKFEVGKRSFSEANRMIDSLESAARRAPERLELARTAADVERIVASGKIAGLIGVEGGQMIEDDLAKLDRLADRGMRYLTLTWNNSTPWATSGKDESEAKPGQKLGLTDFGRQVVRRLNARGVMVDLSHVGPQTFADALATSTKPCIASHSSSHSINPHYRNLRDDQVQALAAKGGVVFVNFYPGFLDSTYYPRRAAQPKQYAREIDALKTRFGADSLGFKAARRAFLDGHLDELRPPLSLLIDHIDHFVKLVGADHVGLGADWDGIEALPLGLNSVADLPEVTRLLLERGYSAHDVRLILGENFLRVLRANAG